MSSDWWYQSSSAHVLHWENWPGPAGIWDFNPFSRNFGERAISWAHHILSHLSALPMLCSLPSASFFQVTSTLRLRWMTLPAELTPPPRQDPIAPQVPCYHRYWASCPSSSWWVETHSYSFVCPTLGPRTSPWCLLGWHSNQEGDEQICLLGKLLAGLHKANREKALVVKSPGQAPRDLSWFLSLVEKYVSPRHSPLE